mgnify:CR=1 FL=1
MELDLDYEEFFTDFVDEAYVDSLDDKGLDIAISYSERGGNPRVCVGVGLYETESYDANLEDIAEDMDVSRRAMFDARERLGLEKNWER